MIHTLDPGIEVLAISSQDAVPADGTTSAVYAIPTKTRILAMSVRPLGTYSTIVCVLQIANNNVDAEFADVVTVTAVAGEYYTSRPLVANFVRVKLVSSTGAGRTGLLVGLIGR